MAILIQTCTEILRSFPLILNPDIIAILLLLLLLLLMAYGRALPCPPLIARSPDWLLSSMQTKADIQWLNPPQLHRPNWWFFHAVGYYFILLGEAKMC